MTYLLDINVLMALFDSKHVHHDAAHRWFAAVGRASWATCPITENGFIRIISNPRYLSVTATPNQAAEGLRVLCSLPGHVFWPDNISLLSAANFDLSHLLGHQQVSDLYLAGLVAANGGRLATFDTAIQVTALVAVPAGLVVVIPTT